MTARGFFVTGTGTGVGKTVVTRALTGALIDLGRRAVALKPIESGVTGEPEDATALGRVASPPLAAREVSLYTFRAPVSPHLAAAREGLRIEKESVLRFLAKWSEQAEIVIAEGAGGLLVPLSESLTYGDLIAETRFELIIVAPNVLGAINATLLTIEAARTRRIPILGVILNGTPEADLGNREAIIIHGRVPVLGEFPRVEPPRSRLLAETAVKSVDLDALTGLQCPLGPANIKKK
jgi:dethiobiotin synthase